MISLSGSYRYMRDGLATTKSDVYAFGVVLFEMVSGKEAMTRSAERRSLVSIVSPFVHTVFFISYLLDFL